MPPTRAPGARLDALVHQAREPIFLLGPDGRFVGVNRAWEELTGHRSGEVAGLECRPHGPTRPGDLAGLGGSFCPPPEAGAGLPSASSTWIVRADGERLRRRVEFWPFHDANGALIGILGVVRPPDETSLAPESEAHRLRAELLAIRDRLHSDHGSDALLGRGPEHRRLLDQVAAAAATTVPILVIGEAGTGKLTVARSIHLQGPRRQAPLLAYDCKALPPEILERELFGTPLDRRAGGLVAPDASTVVIGDVLELPRDLQARLASGLDRRVRLVATTTGDPDAAFRAERIRPDLYYALTTLVVRLRPLRERLDDLPILAQHFLERANLRGEAQRHGFTPDALDALASHDWPGNLRELARVVDDAHGRALGPMIDVGDIPAAIRGERGGAYNSPTAPAAQAPLKEKLARIERQLIEQALELTGGNRSRAARRLGINRPLLYRRIKELGIPDEVGGDSEITAGGPGDPAG